MIWALVIANLMAVFMFLCVARWLGLLAFVRGGVLIPFVFVLAMLGSYLSQGHWQNLVVILLLGILGYGLKRFDWPRAPFVIGLVLGPIAEKALHKSLALWGPAFLLRPISIILIVIIVVSVVLAVLQRRKRIFGRVG